MQLSIALAVRTRSSCSRRAGLVAAVVDYTLFPLPAPICDESRAQIGRVEELSDAYHVTVGDADVMVAYLLEIRHGNGGVPQDVPWS